MRTENGNNISGGSLNNDEKNEFEIPNQLRDMLHVYAVEMITHACIRRLIMKIIQKT